MLSEDVTDYVLSQSGNVRKGAIEVSCTQKESTYTMKVAMPGNTVAEVELPYNGSIKQQVTVNDKVVDFNMENGLIRMPKIGGSTHTIKVSVLE